VAIDKYLDLLYVPLALPPPPKITATEFFTWANEIRPDYNLKKYEAHWPFVYRGKRFPWNNINFVSTNHPDLDFYGSKNSIGSIDQSLDIKLIEQRWPEIYAHLCLFPIQEIVMLQFLNQRREIEVHYDYDRIWGMRTVLQNNGGNTLYIKKSTDKWDASRDRIPLETLSNNPNLLQSEEVQTYAPDSESYSFMINQLRCAHGVKASPEGSEKLVVAIQGRLDHVKLEQLLEESLDQYSNLAVWH
jgi:hypothetical protein